VEVHPAPSHFTKSARFTGKASARFIALPQDKSLLKQCCYLMVITQRLSHPFIPKKLDANKLLVMNRLKICQGAGCSARVDATAARMLKINAMNLPSLRWLQWPVVSVGPFAAFPRASISCSDSLLPHSHFPITHGPTLSMDHNSVRLHPSPHRVRLTIS